MRTTVLHLAVLSDSAFCAAATADNYLSIITDPHGMFRY